MPKPFKSNRCLGCYEPLTDFLYHSKCAKALFGNSQPPTVDTTLREIESFAKKFLTQRTTLTGVQRKLSLNVENERRLTIIGGLGGSYIVKPQTPDYEEMPQIEDLSMHLATVCGIKTAKHGLIPMKDGSLAYLIKRFDRKGKEKIAVEDLCQLSELMTEQKYRTSYERAGSIIEKYSSIPGDDLLRYFELILFSFVIGNNDMHLKNFSLITDDQRRVVLSPAYDLLNVRLLLNEKEDPEQLALPLNGKKNRLRKNDFLKFAETLPVAAKAAEYVIERQIAAQNAMNQWIEKSFLSKKNKDLFKKIISKNLRQLQD